MPMATNTRMTIAIPSIIFPPYTVGLDDRILLPFVKERMRSRGRRRASAASSPHPERTVTETWFLGLCLGRPLKEKSTEETESRKEEHRNRS